MSKKILYVGGGFDILHSDHKKFIQQGIKVFNEKYGIVKQIIIGLQADSSLNAKKGIQRPFFSYEWRKEDMFNFLSEGNINFEIIPAEEFYSPENKDNIVRLVRSDYTAHGDELLKKGFSVEYADSFKSIHTSTIERELLEAKDLSNCDIRKVGALLIRNGQIVSKGYSGSKDVANCQKEIAYQGGQRKGLSKITCNSPHAEAMALLSSEKDDDLLITCSPCQPCAELIASKGIRRVVFIQEYYNLEPINYLRKNSVKIRKAGQ
jgi:dCMP deaminase